MEGRILNMSLPINIIEDTLIKLRDDKNYEIKVMMIQINGKKTEKENSTCEFGRDIDTFTHGIDEWFVNKKMFHFVFTQQ